MRERIEVNPNIHFGKPCVTGTRIPVVRVLELIGEGISFDEILRDYYPDLEADDVRACIRFRDHTPRFGLGKVAYGLGGLALDAYICTITWRSCSINNSSAQNHYVEHRSLLESVIYMAASAKYIIMDT